MARYWFGGGLADWTFGELDGVDGNDDLAQLLGGVQITFWSAETAGTQHTDLLDADGNVLQGDFGRSVLTANPVLEDIKRVFPATLELATVATVLGVSIGVPAGVVSGARNQSFA